MGIRDKLGLGKKEDKDPDLEKVKPIEVAGMYFIDHFGKREEQAHIKNLLSHDETTVKDVDDLIKARRMAWFRLGDKENYSGSLGFNAWIDCKQFADMIKVYMKEEPNNPYAEFALKCFEGAGWSRASQSYKDRDQKPGALITLTPPMPPYFAPQERQSGIDWSQPLDVKKEVKT
jgi:hypothetical protein